MTPSPVPPRARTEQAFFIVLLVGLTLALWWVIEPFYGAVFWGAVLALLFEPMYRRILSRMAGRPTLAALVTLLIILVLVVLPLTLLAVSLVQEATWLYRRVSSGEIDFGRYFEQMVAALPPWATSLLSGFGLGDAGALQTKLTSAISARAQSLAGSAFGLGSNMLDLAVGFCIAMYLLFFLLRDGRDVAARIVAAIPLDDHYKGRLAEQFSTVIRATVKGNVLVAIAQGALGGLALWFLGVHGPILWAVVMAFLSLLPAIGAALVWVPVALYFLATGSVWQGVALLVWGVLVIGLVDNVLRPTLVGKDTRMPDYVVLITTIGGLTVFGLNGFVIGPVIAAMFIAVWQIFSDSRARGIDEGRAA